MKRTVDENPKNIVFVDKICPESMMLDRVLGVKEHSHPYWEIVVYYEGTGVGHVGDLSYRFEPGTAVAIPPGLIHNEKSENGYCDYYISLPLLIATPEITVVRDDTGNIVKLAETLFGVFTQKKNGFLGVANSIAVSIFEFIRALGDENKICNHTRRFMDLIKENMANSAFDIPTEAQKYGISMHHLRYCFENDIGKTPYEYLNELRMENARRLLTDGEMRIKDVAVLSGYGDTYYFSRCFKKYFGMSPKLFKSSIGRPHGGLSGIHTVWKQPEQQFFGGKKV